MADGYEACSAVDKGITRVFALLGKRWTGLILAVLMGRPRAHFAELRRAISGISERMLSDRLTELTVAGLVVREVEEGPPLRVCYRLTDAGAALGPAMDALADWAEQHMPDAPACPRSSPASTAASVGPAPQAVPQAAPQAMRDEKSAVAEDAL